MVETLHEIIEGAVESMNDYRLNGSDCHDIASEIADSHTPHYTRDLMLVAANNIVLAGAAPEDIGPAFDGSNTASNIVAANIYDAIQQTILEECEAGQRDDAGWLSGGRAPGFPRKAEYRQRMLEEG
tara:strand:- start:132 stop:512 length:381 start_codon:yes stop_codon:yes gene_type:complete